MDTIGIAIEGRQGIAASLGDRLAVHDELTDGELLAHFVERGDKFAFEVLVRRHAPMIMGVCRRVLRNEHAAEDTLQAVFIVLLRKAASIQRPELLANWLYGVAFRIARKARHRTGREQCGEIPFEPADALDLQSGPEQQEINAVLDEELHQLPARHRLPLVICYLDGKTHVEAAELLGCPCGSVADRLARARAELRRRLLRRGLVLGMGLLLSLLKQSRASAAVGEALIGKVLARTSPPEFQSAKPRVQSADDHEREHEPDDAPGSDAATPEAIDDPVPSRKRRRSRALLLALFWISLMSLVAIPAYELAGGALAFAPGGRLPRLWADLRVVFSEHFGPYVGAGHQGLALGMAENGMADPISTWNLRRRLTEEERCKRCLGTQCGTEDEARPQAPHRMSLWKRVFDR